MGRVVNPLALNCGAGEIFPVSQQVPDLDMSAPQTRAPKRHRIHQNSTLEIVSIDFKDKLRDYYQRNNKAKGRKHLRCFPGCKQSGHVDNNYCGRPVLVDVTYRMSGASGLQAAPELVTFVEFRPLAQEPSIKSGESTSVIGEFWIPGVVTAATDEGDGLVRVQLAFKV